MPLTQNTTLAVPRASWLQNEDAIPFLLASLGHWGDQVEERMGKDTVKHVHKRMCCRIPCIWSSGAHASVQNTLCSFLPPDLCLSMSPFLLLLFANTSFSFRSSLQIYFLQEVFPHPHGLENFAWFQLCLKRLSVKVTNTQVSGR